MAMLDGKVAIVTPDVIAWNIGSRALKRRRPEISSRHCCS